MTLAWTLCHMYMLRNKLNNLIFRINISFIFFTMAFTRATKDLVFHLPISIRMSSTSLDAETNLISISIIKIVSLFFCGEFHVNIRHIVIEILECIQCYALFTIEINCVFYTIFHCYICIRKYTCISIFKIQFSTLLTFFHIYQNKNLIS